MEIKNITDYKPPKFLELLEGGLIRIEVVKKPSIVSKLLKLISNLVIKRRT
jgi:hypothetical protein